MTLHETDRIGTKLLKTKENNVRNIDENLLIALASHASNVTENLK